MTDPSIATSQASLTLDPPASDLRELAKLWLSPAELGLFGGRRLASLAGLIAAKQALVGFFAEIGGFDPRDFRIGHEPSGKPRVIELPAGLVQGGYRLAWCDLSISHSRHQARALVAGRRP